MGRAFLPAYNAQAVTTERQIVIAAELTTEGVDFEQLDPMIASAERELQAAGVKETPGVVVADAGVTGTEPPQSERSLTVQLTVQSERNSPSPR